MQGAFHKHRLAVEALGVDCCEVRLPQQLDDCDGLIIPGGESTTISKQIAFNGFTEPLQDFAREKAIFGTCAGLVLMAQTVTEDAVPSMGCMDITVERNAYGRQTESFSAPMSLWDDSEFHAVFIRAPQVLSHGDEVEVLAWWEDRPVLLRQGRHLASAFHPELTDDLRIHAYFLELCSTKVTGACDLVLSNTEGITVREAVLPATELA